MLNRLMSLLRGDRAKQPDIRPKKNRRATLSDDNPHRAVEIKPSRRDACEAVKKLTGKRLLVSEAPLLPLRDCTSEKCECRYVSFADRRQDPRRDDDLGITHTMRMSNDRRSSSRGRRKTDVED